MSETQSDATMERTSGDVHVWINATLVTEEASESMVEIVEIFWRPQLPWDVQISRQTDGTELVSRHLASGEEGARMVVCDEGTDLALDPWGSFS